MTKLEVANEPLQGKEVIRLAIIYYFTTKVGGGSKISLFQRTVIVADCLSKFYKFDMY